MATLESIMIRGRKHFLLNNEYLFSNQDLLRAAQKARKLL